jgi:hypothetical protein
VSDFISDLERELSAAARRRAAGRRRVVRPRPRLATVVALTILIALVLAAVAVVRGLEPPRTGDERPAPPPPGPGVTLMLPAAKAATPCPGADQREMAGAAPQGALSVFGRPRTEPDALPSLSGADSYTWIPAGTIYPEGSRRPGRERFDAELHLVPGAEPRQGDRCEGELEADLGVCLVVGAAEPVVKCFSNTDVDGGRALALTGPGMVHGIAPDGVAAVTLRWAGGEVTTAVVDNAFEATVPVQAGDTMRVQLDQVSACSPSAELLDAVPALRDGDWETLSPAAEAAIPTGGRPQWVRRIEVDELEVWVVARCDDGVDACLLGDP